MNTELTQLPEVETRDTHTSGGPPTAGLRQLVLCGGAVGGEQSATCPPASAEAGA